MATRLYPAAMTQPRRSNTTKIVVIVVLGAVLLCGVAGGLVFFLGTRFFSNVLGPPREATTDFVRDLQSGDTTAAYGRLCARTRAEVSAAEFAEIANQRRPKGFTITGTNVSNENGVTTGDITGRLTYADGSTEVHTFPLVKENDVWKVCGDPY
jgi:hypothetical protein